MGLNTESVEAGTVYNDPGVIASNNLTTSIVTVNPVDTAVLGSYTVTYTMTDASGNPVAEATRTVNVVDGIAPVIVLLGPDSVSVETGTVYVDAGATASDNFDGDLPGSIETVNPVDTAVLGAYTVTFNVTDSSGNPAAQVTRTVNVVDSTPPVIALVGLDPVTVEAGGVYADGGATASDNVDGDLTASLVLFNPVDTAVLGSYTVTSDVSDSSGNAANQVTRTVNVVDTTPPVITLLGLDPEIVVLGTDYIDAGATAFDNLDGDVTASIVTINSVNSAVPGSYAVTYRNRIVRLATAAAAPKPGRAHSPVGAR